MGSRRMGEDHSTGMVSKMHAVLPFVLFMCLCTAGKSQGQECEKSTLKRPPNVDLSSLETSYSVGDSVRLRCEPGYTGLQRASCTARGWSVTGRKCQKKPCGHPGDTPNGDFELVHEDDFVFGAVVQYTCKTGYRMMSRNTQRSCMASGWDNDVPVCEEVKCPVIQVADNIQASGNVEDGGYGDVIQFECQSLDMQLSGPGEIHCTNEGKWSDEIPTCKEIQCEKPGIPHGKVTSSQSVFRKDDILRYTCDEEYKVSDGPNPKCTKFGWTSTPECKEITCSVGKASPKTMRHPADQNIFLPGKNIEIECQEGYRTSTYKQKDTFLCGKDGNWLPEKTLDCIEIYCSWPRQYAKLEEYKHQFKFHDTARYSCYSGYKKTKESARCTLEGWTPNPLCVLHDVCLQPTIENGYIVQPDKNKVVFVCNGGFKLNTGGWWKESHCIKGSWSLTPKCIDQNHCTSTPVVENGKVNWPNTDNYSNGYKQRYQCEEGYTSESNEIQCINGEWEKPECKRDGNWCTAPPIVENAIISSQNRYQKMYRNKFDVTYKCRKSYELRPLGEDIVTCNSGNWTNPPTCISVCKAPVGDFSVTYLYKSKEQVYLDKDILQFECKPGYKSNRLHIQCQNTEWDQTNCTRDSEMCTTPPGVDNGTIITTHKKKYPNGSKVEYACDQSFKMDGDNTITCNSGNWNDPPTCKPICDKPDGKHMKLEPDENQYDDGTTVKYICQPPYTANGELRCVNGRWNGQVECRLPGGSCPPFSPPAGSFVEAVHNPQPFYSHDTWVQYQCPRFYVFEDEQNTKNILCFNGEWHYTKNLKCVLPRGSCPSIPPPADSFVEAVGNLEAFYSHNTWVSYQCPQYYIFEDKQNTKKVLCSNGQWRHTENFKCLRPCTVTPEAMAKKNIEFQRPRKDLRYSTHGDRFTFKCIEGRRKKIYDDDMIRYCNDGNITLPECE